MDVAEVAPLGHDEAMALFNAEGERTLDLLRSLEAEDWSAQTECPAWDVHHMYLHVLGACEAGASMAENGRQMLAARRHQKANGGPLEAALSHVQVEARAGLSPAELVERLAEVIPRTVRGRQRAPGLVRKASMKVDGPVVERWTLGYLLDTIYLRDAWMHRVDASRAVGREPVLSAGHDGRIVADVVAEWARRHGQPFELVLTGPAGGSFTGGGTGGSAATGAAGTAGAPAAPGAGSGPAIEMDAVDFCRTLAGREPGHGLLETIVPF